MSSTGLNFTDRNAVESFLETQRFRPCANLKCFAAHVQHDVIYLPVCLQGRFHREGVAEYFDMPLPPRPLSPLTYTSVGAWGPLVSCPRKCKDYRNRTVARILTAITSRKMSNRKPLSRGQKIAIWAIVVPVMVAAINWFVKSKSPQQLQNAANTVSGNQNIIGNNNTIVQPSVEVPAQAPSKTIRNRPQKKTAQENQSPPATRTANAPNGIAITGGTVTNPTVNNYGPPPVEIRFDEHSIQSTDPEFEYEAEVTVSASASYTPVSLDFICDSEIKKVSFDFGRFGAVCTKRKKWS